MSATFGAQDVSIVTGDAGDGTCIGTGTDLVCSDGGSITVDGDVTSGADLNVQSQTLTVASPTSVSVAAATGANAAASTAGVTVEGAADATFANSGGGDVASSEQTGSFVSDSYTSNVSFGTPGETQPLP
ncbi:hypothetical protein [Roseinatronobacter thiooxidans]|nr:hypothetical protein [Roseinatronobacter thiooxidans]